MENVLQLVHDHVVRTSAQIGGLQKVIEALVKTHPNKTAFVTELGVFAQQAFEGLASGVPGERDREVAQQVVDQLFSRMIHVAKAQ